MRHQKSRLLPLALLVGPWFASAAIAAPPSAEEAGSSMDAATEAHAPAQWRLSLTPYLWIPAQNGTVGRGPVRASVDLDIGETFDTIRDNFNFGGALHAELSRDRVTLFADAMYLSLESDDNPSQPGATDVRSDQGIFEVGGAYALVFKPRDADGPGFVFQPLAGLRIQTLHLDIDTEAGPEFSGSQTWVDGFIGAAASVEFSDRLAFRVRGDIGVGESDFTWNALAGIGFAVCPKAVLQFGYRALDTEYDDGRGADKFDYDMILHGPYMALRIVF